jgi:hypothetical protein
MSGQLQASSVSSLGANPYALHAMIASMRIVLAPRRNSRRNPAVCRYEMTTQVADPLSIADRAWLALCLIVFTVGSGWAAPAPIYKCFDKNLSLVYTDEPCKDGEQLDVRAGEADPAAVARLDRQRDALDQSAAQRLADQRRAAAAEELTSRLQYEPADQRADYMPAYSGGYGFWPYPLMHRHPLRHRESRLHHMRHFAPRPPFVVPRR